MADYEAKIAPFINQEFWVTSEFGEPRSGRDPHKRTRYCNTIKRRSEQTYTQCVMELLFIRPLTQMVLDII